LFLISASFQPAVRHTDLILRALRKLSNRPARLGSGPALAKAIAALGREKYDRGQRAKQLLKRDDSAVDEAPAEQISPLAVRQSGGRVPPVRLRFSLAGKSRDNNREPRFV
jgi:hypothetical protein